MTSAEIEAAKAAFLARRAVTVVEAAPAYGVDPVADKERRRATCEAARAEARAEAAERSAERFAEDVREAYHYGGSRARDEVMRGWRRA